MKKLLLPIILATVLFSCTNKEDKGRFTVNGEIKNVSDQNVYLEELFFSDKDPEVLDTAEVKNGHFSISAIAPEQGMYRIRLQKDTVGFIFINDQPVLRFTADAKDFNGAATSFSSAANASLKNFFDNLREQRIELARLSAKLGTDKADNTDGNKDSIIRAESAQMDMMINSDKHWVVKYIDTAASPVMALFAFGVVRDKVEPELLEKTMANLPNRFPGHRAVAAISAQFKTKLAQAKAEEEEKRKFPHEGSTAPDITMNDVNDQPFSLSELRGKYVLVDFWASWCGPCRQENPNVVAAYNKFKDKNFTVLGVSLDQDKAAWMQAIAKDKLAWKQISDLKYWNSAAVGLYGFEGIPYNVLVDPQGKIIGTELRGTDLEAKLEEVLK